MHLITHSHAQYVACLCPLSPSLTAFLLTFLVYSDGKESNFLQLGKPDNVDLTFEFKDWLFALEGAQEMTESWQFHNHEDVGREERCWHSTFQSVRVKTKSSTKQELNVKGMSQKMQKYPLELVTVRILLFSLI